MIGTEQERDAIMAAVQRFGNDCIGYERSTRIFSPTAAESIRAQVHVEKSRERIRAMLAPDDAVLRERAARIETVARAAYADWVASKWDWGSDELRAAIHACVDANDFGLLPVLRGEATR